MGMSNEQAIRLDEVLIPHLTSIHKELVIKKKSLSKYLTVLRCILVVHITLDEQVAMEAWGVWGSVKEIRYMFIHPAPQNQAVVIEGSMLKDPEDVRDEIPGIFSLTELGEQITKEDVTSFIYSKIFKSIASLQGSGIEYVLSVVKGEGIFVRRGNPSVVQAMELIPFDESISATEYVALSDELRDIFNKQKDMVHELISNGMRQEELIERIQKRILHQVTVRRFLEKYPRWYLQFVEMENEKFSIVLKVMQKYQVKEFFEKNGYLFGRLAELAMLQWRRLGALLETPYAADFINEHIYLIEDILTGSIKQFSYTKSVFNLKQPYNYLRTMLQVPGFYQQIKDNNGIQHIFRLLSNKTVCAFLMEHEVFFLPIVLMSDQGVENSIAHLAKERNRSYLHEHPEKLRKEDDWALVVIEADPCLAKHEMLEFSIFP